MPHDFDRVVDRLHTDSEKWRRHGDGVLPMWVADMDFRSPEPVIVALRERVEHGVFGYGDLDGELQAVIQERLKALYDWDVETKHILALPGLVSSFNLVARAIGTTGDGVLLKTPAYFPFFQAIDGAGRALNGTELSAVQNGETLHYEIDFDAFEAAITPRTRLFILCNPHNPVGRVYTRAELERLAEICLRHDLVICSDEAHCDLILEGTHVPIATLAPEVAARCITLQAPSKTFNLSGLACGFAVVQNPDLLTQLQAVAERIVPHVNLMGYTGAVAAYRHGGDWLDALLPYLRANRDALVDFVGENLPGIQTTCPQGTYLAWLDCRELDLPESPSDFFLNEARVALNDGAEFGQGGEGFVRLNFGCPRSTLVEGLERMRATLDTLV